MKIPVKLTVPSDEVYDVEEIGIQVTAIRGSEGDRFEDFSPMLLQAKPTDDGFEGFVDAPQDFAFADEFRFSIFVRRDDGAFHPEPVDTWVVAELAQ